MDGISIDSNIRGDYFFLQELYASKTDAIDSTLEGINRND